MSDDLAKYIFFPWLRQGLAQLIDIEDNPRNNPELQRATFPVVLNINNTPEIKKDGSQNPDRSWNPKINVYGPGDVVGIDHRIIIRTDPKNNIGDLEPNYFPCIEFSEPDFPWCYTPAKPLSSSPARLRPWICLIVLKAPGQDGAEYTPGVYDPARPLPYIRIHDKRKSLPDLSQSWAWAHIQVISEKDTAPDISELLKTEPERVISRLMCARKLEPRILYHAFVVPSFELGRMAGLGNFTFLKEDGTKAKLLDPAWTLDSGAIDIPYYYKWEFRTGLRGDFEYLIRLLQPRPLDKRVGIRPMDCSDLGYKNHIQPPEVIDPEGGEPTNILGLEGALKSINTESTVWPAENRQDIFQTSLENLLNLPAENLQTAPENPPVVTPPIHGCWHKAVTKVEVDGFKKNWLDTLNLDPRYRAAAGFGTRVVQEQQEELMAAAWKQIGSIEEANQLLRQAQLSRAASEKIHEKHLKAMPLGALLRATSSLHSRLMIDDKTDEGSTEKVTVSYHISESRIPAAAFDSAFRRIRRPRGPLSKCQKQDDVTDRKDILERLNDGEVAAAGEHPKPTPGIGDVSDTYRQRFPWANGFFWKILKYLPVIFVILAALLLVIVWLLNRFGITLSPNYPLVIVAQIFLIIAAFLINRQIVPGNLADNIREEKLTSELVHEAINRPPRDFIVTKAGTFDEPLSGYNATAQEFGEFAAAIQDFLNYKPSPKPAPKEIDLAKVRNVIIETVNPRKTIPKRVNDRLSLKKDELSQRTDELDVIMAAPQFDRPMYEPLRDLSQDLMLPGLEYIPQNTVGLLLVNNEFIEAYMVGLNHEFARELLWREYPTDQRGTCFRQFWDVKDIVPDESMVTEYRNKAIEDLQDKLNMLADEEEKEKIIEKKMEYFLKERFKDINPIHDWHEDLHEKNLGENNCRAELELARNKGNLALIVRGDLLKKYPSAVIYAAAGSWEDIRSPEDIDPIWVRRPIFDHADNHTKTPIFKGTLPADITFIGFNLTVEEAKGSTKQSEEKPGWFFVIEERVSETRFGMDEYSGTTPETSMNTWAEISWGHFMNENGLTASGYANTPNPPTPENKVKRDDGTNRIIEPDGVSWDSHAGNRAWITLQKPMRVAMHADQMIPKEE